MDRANVSAALEVAGAALVFLAALAGAGEAEDEGVLALAQVASQYAQSRYDEAMASLDAAAARLSGSPDVPAWRTRILASQRRFIEATGAARQWVESAPGDPEALRELGLLLAATGEYAEAREHLARAQALRPSWVSLPLALAVVCHRMGDRSAAASHEARVLLLSPTDPVVYLHLARARFAAGDLAGAAALLAAGLARGSGDTYSLLVESGIVDLHRGRYLEARAAFARATSRRADDAEVRGLLEYTERFLDAAWK